MIDNQIEEEQIEKLKLSIDKTLAGISALEDEFVALCSAYLDEDYNSIVQTRQFLLPYTLLIKAVEVNNQIFGYSSSSEVELPNIEPATNWLEFSKICRTKGLSKASLIKRLRLKHASRPARKSMAYSVREFVLNCPIWAKLFVQQKARIEIRQMGLVSDVRQIFGLLRLIDPRFLIVPNNFSGGCRENEIWSKRLKFYESVSQKEYYADLSWVLFFIVPPSVVEDFTELRANTLSLLSQTRLADSINVFCLTSHFSSDLMRMIRFGKNLGSNSVEKVLNVVQHGGQFGTQRIVVTEWMDMFLADQYLVFGNPNNYGVAGGEYVSSKAEESGFGNVTTIVSRVPVSARLEYNADVNPSGYIVLILPTAPGEAQHAITCGLISSNVESFYAQIAQFVGQLDTKKDVKIKLSPKQFGLTYQEYCLNRGLNARFVGGSVVQQIMASNLAIIAYDGTAALEALALGRPFLWVIETEFFPLRHRTRSVLISVLGSGVVHFSFGSALDFLRQLKNIPAWWLAPETRKAVEYLRSEIGVMLV